MNETDIILRNGIIPFYNNNNENDIKCNHPCKHNIESQCDENCNNVSNDNENNEIIYKDDILINKIIELEKRINNLELFHENHIKRIFNIALNSCNIEQTPGGYVRVWLKNKPFRVIYYKKEIFDKYRDGSYGNINDNNTDEDFIIDDLKLIPNVL